MSANLQSLLAGLTELPEEDQKFINDAIQNYISNWKGLDNILHKSSDYFKRMIEASFLTRQILGPYTNGLLVNTDSGIYVVDPEDYAVGWELRKSGSYESEQLKRLKGLVNSDTRVLIVGAHVGTMAIPLADVCKHVTAVEANPQTFGLLEMNIKLNHLTNCDAFNIAASDSSSDIRFLLNKSNSGGSKRKPIIDQYIYSYDNPEEISVPGARLDDYFAGRSFDLIVMDIEGSEYFALKGMSRLLSESAALMIEFLPHHLRNISGVTVKEFLSTLMDFQILTIPSLNKKVELKEFAKVLEHMYSKDLIDDGIIFEKV